MSKGPALKAARIVGVYTTEQKRSHAPRTSLSLAMESIKGALDDAGLEMKDVDAVLGAPLGWPPGYAAISGGMQGFWARQLGKPMHWGSNNYGVSAVIEAAAMIEAGLLDVAVVVCAFSGANQPSFRKQNYQDGSAFTAWTGSLTPAQYALVASRWVHERGPTVVDAMAEATAVVRNFGALNPGALYGGRPRITAADVLASRMIAEPLTLLMCCANNDGGGAVVLTRADRAADTRKGGKAILCTGEMQSCSPYIEPPVLVDPRPVRNYIANRMAAAGIAPADLDILQLYDNFAIHILDQLESFGIAEIGAAQDLVLSGALGLGGRYPTCTDGGLMAFGHLGGFLYRVVEAVRQLRDEVDDQCPDAADGVHTHDPALCRHVANAQLALCGNPGSPTGTANFMVIAR